MTFRRARSRGLAILKTVLTKPNFYLPPNNWSVHLVKGKQQGIGTRLPTDFLAQSPEQIAAVRHWEKWWEECSPRKST